MSLWKVWSRFSESTNKTAQNQPNSIWPLRIIFLVPCQNFMIKMAKGVWAKLWNGWLKQVMFCYLCGRICLLRFCICPMVDDCYGWIFFSWTLAPCCLIASHYNVSASGWNSWNGVTDWIASRCHSSSIWEYAWLNTPIICLDFPCPGYLNNFFCWFIAAHFYAFSLNFAF